MAIAYNSIQALINEHYMKVVEDNIFRNHMLFSILLKKSKDFLGRKITVPLEYADGSHAAFTPEYGTIPLTPINPFTAASYTPKMLTDSILISHEEELVMNAPEAIKNIVDAKVKNVMKGMKTAATTSMWARTLPTNGWTPLYTLLDATSTVGGIAVADFAGWATPVVDLTGGTYTGNAALESDLVDPASDVYLLKIYQRGIANAKYQTGENPDIIVVPQYIYDLTEFILTEKKNGSPLSTKAASMGFTALDYRGADIVADDDSVAAQTGDVDGLMWFLNTAYMNYNFNPGAKFKAAKFVRAANQNAMSSLVNAYGDLTTSNRGAHCLVKNIRSPKSYSQAS